MLDDMKEDSPVPKSKTRKILWTIGLMLGGLAPLVTGVIGIWGYITLGYITSKTGEIIDDPSGIFVSGLFIIAGIWMIVYAIRQYLR